MKFALVNPNWTFEGSTYFGCREPHFPLELLSAREMLRSAGHEVLLVDALMEDLSPGRVSARLDAFGEDYLVLPTAPSYLFWRCPQPELRVPRDWIAALNRCSCKVSIGPHGSATPQAALDKTGADVVLRGEPDQTLSQLATLAWEMVPGCCWRDPSGDFIWLRGSESLIWRRCPCWIIPTTRWSATIICITCFPAMAPTISAGRGSGVCSWLPLLLHLLQ